MNSLSACKNCGHNFKGKFCNECGQKADIHRFTVKHILHDFFHAFTHVDSGILYLIKELFLRPGDTVREYLEGKRKKYFNPFQYFVLATAVVVFLTIKLDIAGSMLTMMQFNGDSSKIDAFRLQFLAFFYQTFNYLQFIILPFLGFFSYIFFRKSGYNFAENLVFNTFLSAQRHIIFLVFAPLWYFFPASFISTTRIYMLIWMAYFAWSYVSFFKPKNKVWGVIKSIFVCILFFSSTGVIALILYWIFYIFGWVKGIS